jgi:hypothetical protein
VVRETGPAGCLDPDPAKMLPCGIFAPPSIVCAAAFPD